MNFRLKLSIDLGFFECACEYLIIAIIVMFVNSFKYFKIIIIIVSYYVLNSDVII